MKNIVVPELGESISEATVLTWFKKPGEAVAMDEALVELETDKVTVEVNAPAAGVLQDISAEEGAVVKIGDVIGAVDETATAPTPQEAKEADEPPKAEATQEAATPKAAVDNRAFSGPAVTKQLAEQGLKPTDIKAPSGRGGRITPEDVHRHMREKTTQVAHASEAEERVPMSRLRQKIAERLKAAQNTAAILTTFNEVDMSAVMGLRAKYKDEFAKVHGVKLGFMSFFVKACVKALQEFPAVNAAIDGTDIVFKKNYHIGVAVGTDRGLVVPVVRHAEQLSLADIEREIGRLGALARDGKLEIADLQGGTFSISNGGVYGSLLSTPILNAPQSGILGMHKIEKRAVVVNDEVVVRPMMYLALSYDHRIIDGREAVTFLTKIKEALEEPERMLLNL